LGAYEALWARQDTEFKSIAEAFSAHAGAIPSDFVARAEIEKYSRVALAAIRHAGIRHFGIRVHGTPGYPARRRDFVMPTTELAYSTSRATGS
jgi:DNA processing protein